MTRRLTVYQSLTAYLTAAKAKARTLFTNLGLHLLGRGASRAAGASHLGAEGIPGYCARRSSCPHNWDNPLSYCSNIIHTSFAATHVALSDETRKSTSQEMKIRGNKIADEILPTMNGMKVICLFFTTTTEFASRCGIGEIRLSIELNFASHTKDMHHDKLSQSPSYSNVGQNSSDP